MLLINPLSEGKKVYFVSDFHLGVPDYERSLERERKIVRWLDLIKKDAAAVFILGDIFDFWYEYKYTIPKGFIRFQGKLAEMTDAGIPIYFFTGNHDMWMFQYFKTELNIPVLRDPLHVKINDKDFLIGHGDGLGPGDRKYKLLKKVFNNAICQLIFGVLPSRIGFGIAHKWSRKSRLHNETDNVFLGEKEHLWIYCKDVEKRKHHDYYIFGHRHLPLDLDVGIQSRYVNLGEWIHHFNYAIYDGNKLEVKKYDESS